MQPGLTGILVAVGVVVLLLLLAGIWAWASYHSLVALRTRVDEAWEGIVVQVRRRAELVPSIVDQVAGYASHESTVLETVDRARTETLEASTPSAASAAEGHLQTALRGAFSVSESFPQLQASQSFLQLQSELVATEDSLQAARRSYNGGVRELNAKAAGFPARLFARRLGVTQREFFEVSEPSTIAEPPRVQF
jgi:LemA protein